MRIGLVLSGGMAKGAYQVGVLKAISEYILPQNFSYISSSSVGVLNSYAFVAGTLDKAEDIWKNLCNNNKRMFVGKLLRSSLLQENIGNIYNESYKFEFPFFCSLVDFRSKNVVYKDLSIVESSELLLYLKASVAMPVYNKAVRINGDLYFDGAMIDNIPVYPLQNKPLDYIICVYFDNISYKFENNFFDNRIIKITFPAENALRQSAIFSRDNIEKMILSGYERTSFLLDPIFAKGVDNLDCIYSRISEMNRKSEKGMLRVTGDMVVTNINRVAKRLLKQRIV